GFNAVVEIYETPRQLPRKQRPDGGLAGTHEAGQAQHLGNRLPADSRDGWLTHEVKNSNRATRCKRRRAGNRELVALEDADRTTVGRELDFGQTASHGAEQALGEFRSHVLHTVRIGLEVCFGLIVDRTGSGLRVEIERIVAGKVHLHGAFATAHGVDAGADEVSVEQNIAGGRKQSDVGEAGLQQLCVSAHRAEVEFSGALRANQRAVCRSDHDVAGQLFEVNVARNALQGHVSHDLLDVDQSGLGPQFQFGFFGNAQLKIDFELVGLSSGVHDMRGHVNAIARALRFQADLA